MATNDNSSDHITGFRKQIRNNNDVPLISPRDSEAEQEGHPLDSAPMVELHHQLMAWYQAERTKQSINRYQMALDEDFYDGLQWGQADMEELNERGQAPLVFNLVKPTVDWITGTEKRTSFDWRILPRKNEGSKLAEIKTQYMKYLDDVNHAQHNFSRAFADAAKVGVGWLECGIRGDDSDELIYDAYESWRNVVHDTSGRERDIDIDGRYLFRWKWIDEDISLKMFPDRADVIRAGVNRSSDIIPQGLDEAGEEFWYLGQAVTAADAYGLGFDRRTYVTDTSYVNYRRRRIRLIESYWKEPTRRTMMRGGGVLHGQTFNPEDDYHKWAARKGVVSLFDGLRMEMHAAIMTEKALVWAGKSPYRHNRFPLTPIWCFRRGRDNAPYGYIRQLRDPQEDYNKRASKALWRLSTVRVVMEDGAVSDIDELRDEVSRPDAIIVKKRGSELEIQEGASLIQGELEMMERDHMHIQSTSGVTDELMGRKTNAVSGTAIEARQNQGSVVTLEIFDNARFSRQIHGQKRLSLCEQFTTEERVIRITGAKGDIDWLHVNQPVVNADGSVTFLNDITEEQADFIVSETDYNATYRQAMFEVMMGYMAKLPPELSMKLLPHIVEMSDLPDKDEFVREIREALGLEQPEDNVDPDDPQAVAEAQAKKAAQEQAAQEQAALAQEAQSLALQEQKANIGLVEAKTAQATADAEAKIAGIGEQFTQLIEQMAMLRQMMEAQNHAVEQQAQAQAQQQQPTTEAM